MNWFNFHAIGARGLTGHVFNTLLVNFNNKKYIYTNAHMTYFLLCSVKQPNFLPEFLRFNFYNYLDFIMFCDLKC